MPLHSAISVGDVQLSKSGEQAGLSSGIEETPLLRVRRPALTQAPQPPVAIQDWLLPGWEDPGKDVHTIQSRNFRRGAETVTLAFESEPARVQALEDWKTRRGKWAEAERPAREAMRVFEKLFDLRAKIALESERVELMLGDGRLRWRRPEGEVDHPVLLQRVDIEFDPDVPELSLVDADRVPELYGTLLLGNDGLSSDALNKLRVELEERAYHPLEREGTSNFLRRMVHSLPHGIFSDKGDLSPLGSDPTIARDPVLFLRARLSGFPAAFDRVLEGIDRRGELPVSLMRLVGVAPPPSENEPAPARSPWGEPEDILLSKPANLEQVELARALERHHAVLVQGPPGTGKSHTIANLIGHLMAQGKRVLVTSHTTKALRVLRGLIAPELLPLCVAVLENDIETRSQMEKSVRAILARLTVSHEETLQQEVEKETERRRQIILAIEQITGDIAVAREAEYKPIVLAGEPVAPSDAAKWVQKQDTENDWIPGPIEPGAPIPLSHEKIHELYGLAVLVTGLEEREIADSLPALDDLPNTSVFKEMVAALGSTESPEYKRFWSHAALEDDISLLNRLFNLIKEVSGGLDSMAPWQRKIVAAGYSSGKERDLWLGLRDQVIKGFLQGISSRRSEKTTLASGTVKLVTQYHTCHHHP